MTKPVSNADRAARYARNAIRAERKGRHEAAEKWKAYLAYMIESKLAYLPEHERIDHYHAELAHARREHGTRSR